MFAYWQTDSSLIKIVWSELMTTDKYFLKLKKKINLKNKFGFIFKLLFSKPLIILLGCVIWGQH